ncbi:Type 1 glutamine amidotransferase [Dissulfuribacter thermophilus]|uniref:Type 1 glutamine amidotransferase n=1 Tax=Dissulfuribacter thermophilus TaxID=1156395 RepID=A0A1B9F685_9BACT|nr:DJ-1 family glyoxalase III [Dissulfuribacter thermophilus]OCC15281.1 Type 1 glutamine amidotransferase [Dissulfuribacter thermophilus]
MTSKRVAVLLAPGYEELEAVTVVDIFRRAGIECDIVGLEKGPIPSARDVKIIPDVYIDEALDQAYDLIVLPGGIDGTENLAKDDRVVALLTRQLEMGKKVGAICAAPTVLERHNLVTGKTITCHPITRDAIKKANISDDRVVVDGLVITSQGPGTAMDFALKLVEDLVGPQKVEELKKGLLV